MEVASKVAHDFPSHVLNDLDRKAYTRILLWISINWITRSIPVVRILLSVLNLTWSRNKRLLRTVTTTGELTSENQWNFKPKRRENTFDTVPILEETAITHSVVYHAFTIRDNTFSHVQCLYKL